MKTVRTTESRSDSAGGHVTAPKSAFWTTTTFRWATLSAIAVWLAFPPVGWWPLAWIAPLGWVRLIRRPQLDGRRPYFILYLVGCLHWLLMTQWVRLPHWSAGIGWFFLAAYLAAYVPLFVGLSRALVHRVGISSVIAAPTVWVALELVRGHLFTGFSLALLAHSQIGLLPLLQIASVTGAYGVSFVIMLVAAGCERSTCGPSATQPLRKWWPIGAATGVTAVIYVYGLWTLHALSGESGPTARVAIIQGSFDTVFDGGPERSQRAFAEYRELSRQAIATHKDIDLVVWPESMFLWDIIRYDDNVSSPSYWPGYCTIPETARISETQARETVSELGTECLMGTNELYCGATEMRRYNTAGFYRRDGTLMGVYHKMHPVMFGEYVPLGKMFPWLYELTPMHSGLSSGTKPVSFQAGDVWFSPCICFENTVPHLIRRQVATLQHQGAQVNALVTITNDGWFWGSSLLDLHLACGIFRAVENRKPMLIAANTGFSAWIDCTGKLVQRGPRQATGVLVADVVGNSAVSVYTEHGDWFAVICLLLTSSGAVFGWMRSDKSIAKLPAEARQN